MGENGSRGQASMEFIAEAKPGNFLVRGELTFATAASGVKQAAALFAENPRVMRFDFAGVDRVDSSGVGLLIEWLRMARSCGCQLNFSNISPALRAMIRVGGVDGILPVQG